MISVKHKELEHPTVRMVLPLERLTAFDGEQRSFKIAKLAKMRGDRFNAQAVGVLIVSARADGTYHILDGQHRVAVLREQGYDEWACDVHFDLTRAQESELFHAYNQNRSNLTKLENHHALSRSTKDGRDPSVEATQAREIDEACAATGYYIPQAPGASPANALFAVDALESVWKIGGKPMVINVLAIMHDAWANDEQRTRDGKSGSMIRAIAYMLGYHVEHAGYDRDHLVEVLKEIGPRMLQSLALDKQERLHNLPQYRAVYLTILERYNRGRNTARTLKRQDRALNKQKVSWALPPEKAEEIAQRVLDGATAPEIAIEFGVSESTVHDIKNGKRYTRTIDLSRYGDPNR